MAEAKVLLVDDEIEFLESASERLGLRGFQVDTAENGPAALAKIEGKIYDAIVLDMMMPGQDGLETLKQALAKKPDLQIILLTGHATVEKGIQAMKAGAMDFLEKPANLDELAEKIKQGQAKRIQIEQKDRQQAVSDIMKRVGW